MKIRAQGIVKMVVGSVASIMVIAAAGSFSAPGVVRAEEATSTVYQQTDRFVADDGSKVTIYESQPAPSQPSQNTQGIQQGQNTYQQQQQQPNQYQQAPQQNSQQPQDQQGQSSPVQVQPSQNQQSQPQIETPIDGDAGLGTAELVVVE